LSALGIDAIIGVAQARREQTMRLSLEQVEHVASLARLALTDEEKELFSEQLSSILQYAERLQALDTSAIPPTASVLPLENVMRDDEVQPSLSREEAMQNAPVRSDGYFQVPVVLEGNG
jgi:aspartyl-tRNA(Asn)/glutamyl-tRNA(Gln) amidotransferase subunit C